MVALVTTGCAATSAATAPSATSTTSPSPSPGISTGSNGVVDLAGPPPIILTDSSARHLALSLHLTVGGYDASTRNTTEIGIGFSSQGRAVRFAADERMTCNGAAGIRGGGGFDFKLPTEALAGKAVSCTYTSGKTSATVTFTTPVALAILSPQEHAQVTRGKSTVVRFRVGGSNTMFYAIALGPNTKSWTYPVGNPPTQAILDTSAFAPGKGFIALSQHFSLPDLHGAGFASLDGQGTAAQQIEVAWV